MTGAHGSWPQFVFAGSDAEPAGAVGTTGAPRPLGDPAPPPPIAPSVPASGVAPEPAPASAPKTN